MITIQREVLYIVYKSSLPCGPSGDPDDVEQVVQVRDDPLEFDDSILGGHRDVIRENVGILLDGRHDFVRDLGIRRPLGGDPHFIATRLLTGAGWSGTR